MGKEQEKKQKAKFSVWLANLSYIGVLITLILIVVQVYYAKQTMIESNEWEKAKVTIENIERFKEKLKETALYGRLDILAVADRGYPDFTTDEGFHSADTLRKIYFSLFEGNRLKMYEDFLYTLDVLDAFAYPIIMGYASETGSYQSVRREFGWFSNFIMPDAFQNFKPIGLYAKLLHRLWRVKSELLIIPKQNIEKLKTNNIFLLYFEGTEVTPATIKQYEKKLEKELKKIQKEIEEFRKNSLK